MFGVRKKLRRVSSVGSQNYEKEGGAKLPFLEFSSHVLRLHETTSIGTSSVLFARFFNERQRRAAQMLVFPVNDLQITSDVKPIYSYSHESLCFQF